MKAVHQPTRVVSECLVKINLPDAGKQIATAPRRLVFFMANNLRPPKIAISGRVIWSVGRRKSLSVRSGGAGFD